MNTPKKTKKHARPMLDKWTAYAMCGAGMVLLIVSLLLPPRGVIDSSVLVAFGEILTFSGALLGIAYIHPNSNPK